MIQGSQFNLACKYFFKVEGLAEQLSDLPILTDFLVLLVIR